MKTMSLLLFVIATTTLISGCANRADDLREQGYSTTYIQGDSDGCYSGKSAAQGLAPEPKKDAELFTTNYDYSKAWSAAFKICKRKEEAKAHNRMVENNIKEQQRIKMRSTATPTPTG